MYSHNRFICFPLGPSQMQMWRLAKMGETQAAYGVDVNSGGGQIHQLVSWKWAIDKRGGMFPQGHLRQGKKKKKPASHPAPSHKPVFSVLAGSQTPSRWVSKGRPDGDIRSAARDVYGCATRLKSSSVGYRWSHWLHLRAAVSTCTDRCTGVYPSLLSPSMNWLQSCACSPSVEERSSDSPSFLPIKCNGAHANTSEKKHLPLLL